MYYLNVASGSHWLNVDEDVLLYAADFIEAEALRWVGMMDDAVAAYEEWGRVVSFPDLRRYLR